MVEKRAIGCIFEDTPKECSSIDMNGQCLDLGKIRCLFNHNHLIVAKDAKTELVNLLIEEINTKRRYKRFSGLAGRQH